jgi:hypothetical protein
MSRGWDRKCFSPTPADYYVDAAAGSPGDGRSPATAFTTIGEAIARVRVDGARCTVAVIGDAAVYRERIVLNGCDGLTLRGYGTDKPTITGQDVLTGWEQCTRADAPDLGPNYASIWKARIRNDALAVGVTAMNLYEGETPVPVCQVRRPGADLFFRFYDSDFVRADAFILDAKKKVVGIKDADVFAGLAARDLVGRAYVLVYGGSNSVGGATEILGFDGADTIRIAAANSAHKRSSDPAPDRLRYNLCNCLPKMTRGTHGALDNGDGTTTIYVWPNDVGSLAGAMSYAARDTIIEASNTTGQTLEGLRIIGVAGAGKQTGQCIRARQVTDMTVRHCLIGDAMNNGGGYGALWAQESMNFRLEQCDLRNTDGTYTAFFQSGRGGAPGHGTVVRQNRGYRLAETAFRFYGQRNAQMVFNEVSQSGFGGHVNAWNLYAGCDTVLVYGNKFRDLIGYGTWQDSSNLFVGMNLQQQNMSRGDNRALQDQMRLKAAPPKPGSTNWFWNNHILPDPKEPENTTSVSLGKPWRRGWKGSDDTHPLNNRYVFLNNIVHGGGVVEPYERLKDHESYWRDRPGFGPNYVERDRRGNLYTGLAYWQTPRAPYFWERHATEVIYTTLATIYADTERGDFRTRPDSPLLTHPGVDLSDLLAAARQAFPDFDFTVDCDGLPIADPKRPTVGCFHSDYNAQVSS